MALILDHINGVATDNRLENLRIVCPNCAATLETHCGRNDRRCPAAVTGGDGPGAAGPTRPCAPTPTASPAGSIRSNRTRRPAHEHIELDCERCGKRFLRRRPGQRFCSRECGTPYPRRPGPRLGARKVERPPYEVLLREIADTNYVAVGRKYGVSDNAIRKWLRAYERELGVAPLPRAA